MAEHSVPFRILVADDALPALERAAQDAELAAERLRAAMREATTEDDPAA